MPNLDATGPQGKGPKTGRGVGNCDTQKRGLFGLGRGRGRGNRQGSGRGQGRGMRWPWQDQQ